MMKHDRSGRNATEFLEDVSLNRIWAYLDYAIENAACLGREKPSERHTKRHRQAWLDAKVEEGFTDSESDSEDSDFDGNPFGIIQPKKEGGTGSVIPTIFVPSFGPSDPAIRFRARQGPMVYYRERFIYGSDRTEVLSYAGGACLSNDSTGAQAGWAFVFGPDGEARTVTGRLEEHGPFGDKFPATSSRAELRAVIAALRFGGWVEDGFQTLVIATDSDYTVKGATELVGKWMQNDWKTSKKQAVKNKDLWQLLLGDVEILSRDGLAVQFWHIRKKQNLADEAAQKAASSEPQEHFDDILSVGGI
ncbi:ribonuclease H-like domain-containing protein [Xylariomycetidae sp. FL2044]|nr:ribonuclease H-like domain-containing protein [Xylariomycetidae sp. FL2044]